MTMLTQPTTPFLPDTQSQPVGGQPVLGQTACVPAHEPERLAERLADCLPDALGSLRSPVEAVARKALDAIDRLTRGFGERGDSPAAAKAPPDKAPALAQQDTAPQAHEYSTIDVPELMNRLAVYSRLSGNSGVIEPADVDKVLSSGIGVSLPERQALTGLYGSGKAWKAEDVEQALQILRDGRPPDAAQMAGFDSNHLLALVNRDNKSSVVSLTEVREGLEDPALSAAERSILETTLLQSMLGNGQTSWSAQEFKDNADLLARTPW